MKTLLLALLLAAPQASIALTVAMTGVNGEDLADTPMTDAINMEAGQITNQLSLTLTVTAGTSTRVVVTCYESEDNVTYGRVSVCTSAASASCAPDIREFTLADYSGSISSRWPVTKKWIKCSADDPDDGTGTVIVTGARSYR